MTDQKHFKYEGNVTLNKPEREIVVEDVVFLTPAKISVLIDNVKRSYMASVDIINRKVYVENGDDFLTDAVFDHLDQINILPEDFFAAPDEVTAEADKAEADRERIHAEQIGDSNA